MRQFVGTSLKTRLYLLVLAAFLPVAALIFYVAEEQKTIEKADILQKTSMLARATVHEENQQLELTRSLLTAVGHAFRMNPGRVEQLSGLLEDLAGQSSGYADIGIVDAGGHRLAGSNPSAAGREYDDCDWLSASLQSREMTMGAYVGEMVDGQPVVYFAQPASDGRDRVAAVAFVALNLNWMNRAIFEQLADLPGGSRLTLLDESQGLLRYDVDAGQWSVPRDFDAGLRREIAGRPAGTSSAADETGIARIYAFASMTSPLRSRRVSVVLEILRSVALEHSSRIFKRNVALLAVSALMAVLSIWWATDKFVIRRVRAMVRASRRLADGELDVRIGKIGVRDELSHLAGVFDEMAAALQMRMEREAGVMASLEQSRERIRRLAAHQQEVREHERIRIAREIHDQLGQSLTILKMDLAWLKKQAADEVPSVVEKMDAMSGVIDGALKSLHAVTAELRPVILDDFGLAAAIEWQAEEFQNRSGIACRLENRGFEPDLPRDQATALFRIFQEILTNIIRHARADEVVVRLEAAGDELIFQVSDNGRGITEEQIEDPRSYGLLGIRERLYPFNGRVTFEARPGRGTRVAIRLPLSIQGDR